MRLPPHLEPPPKGPLTLGEIRRLIEGLPDELPLRVLSPWPMHSLFELQRGGILTDEDREAIEEWAATSPEKRDQNYALVLQVALPAMVHMLPRAIAEQEEGGA